jgi:hypothetical protein
VTQLPRPDGRPVRQLANCLDRAFSELNAFLLVIVIGLAALDFTCFAALRVSSELARARLAAQTPSSGPLVAGGANLGVPWRM